MCSLFTVFVHRSYLFIGVLYSYVSFIHTCSLFIRVLYLQVFFIHTCSLSTSVLYSYVFFIYRCSLFTVFVHRSSLFIGVLYSQSSLFIGVLYSQVFFIHTQSHLRVVSCCFIYSRWMNPLIKKGYARQLEIEDMYNVADEDLSDKLGEQLEQ